MPRSRRTASRSSSRRSRTPTAWMSGQTIPVDVGVGVTSVVDMLDPAVNLPEGYLGGLTIRRMFARLSFRPFTANSDTFGQFGITLVTRDAIAAGAASLPSPLADNVDWYLRDGFAYTQSALISEQQTYDIRTARRVRGEDRSMVFLLSVSAAAGSALSQFSLNFRLLIQRS